MAVPLPLPLKAIQPFLKVAKDMRKNDAVTAYYCDLHAMQSGMKIDTSPPSKKFLLQLMSSLEKQKQQLSQDPDNKEAITSEVVGETIVENQAAKLFAFADNNDRNSVFNKNVVRAFYTSAILYDVVDSIGEEGLGDEGKDQRKYARWKATYIHNCLKNGEIPQPGPIGGLEDSWNESGDAEGADQQLPSTSYQDIPPPQPSQPPAGAGFDLPKPAARTKPAEVAPAIPHVAPSYNTPTPSYPSSSDAVELTPVQFNEATKLCKYASSAIMYQDVPTALENLEKCILLLKTGKT